jgi:hypothetical protein
MKVIAWSQNMTAEIAEAAGATLVPREELFREADVVTIHLVLSARTQGLVGAAELALMKPASWLVNTSDMLRKTSIAPSTAIRPPLWLRGRPKRRRDGTAPSSTRAR